MIGLSALLLGFAVLRFALVGLPIVLKLSGIVLGGLSNVFIVILPLLGPKRLMEIRYARQIAKELPGEHKFVIDLALLKGKEQFGTDFGVLTLDYGCLQFHGLRTSFAIPRSQIRLRRDPEDHVPPLNLIKLLTQVEDEAISINFSEPGRKAKDPTLNERFDQFWRAASEGEFVPPPTRPSRREWSGRFFPGWQRVAFWSVVHVLVIVQATILDNRGDRTAQLALATIFFGTLVGGIIAEGFRLYRLFRSPLDDIPLPTPPETTVITIPEHERPETRVRA